MPSEEWPTDAQRQAWAAFSEAAKVSAEDTAESDAEGEIRMEMRAHIMSELLEGNEYDD